MRLRSPVLSFTVPPTAAVLRLPHWPMVRRWLIGHAYDGHLVIREPGPDGAPLDIVTLATLEAPGLPGKVVDVYELGLASSIARRLGS
jgi:hypothetical protein